MGTAYLSGLFDLYPNVIFYFASLRFICYICAHCCCESQFESFARYVHSTYLHTQCAKEREIARDIWIRNSIDNPCPCACRDVHLGTLGQWESRKLPADLARNFSHFFQLLFLLFLFAFAISFVTHAISRVCI